VARAAALALAALCLAVPAAGGAPTAAGAPPAGLTAYGRTVWNLEALLREAFAGKEVWLHYRGGTGPGAVWDFSTATTALCCGGRYHFTFAAARGSAFSLRRPARPPKAIWGPSAGEIPLTVRRAFVSCGGGRWLFRHVGNGPANSLVSCLRP
jgi:hypothetical protein